MKKLFTKIILALAFLGIGINHTQAQYVTIPDANFVTWLTSNYPACMTGNQMDTTCSAIINEDSVIASGLGIHDLTGIQYFDNLLILKCYNDSLSSMPNLPINLTYLDCSFNQITSLSSLPNNLNYLDCKNNQIISLPNLPSALGGLNCKSNQISILPNLLNDLTYLDCSFNNISTLPNLPNLLGFFNCDHNQIITLPTLPNSVSYLSCNNNLITSLPTLPNSLQYLFCGSNQLSILPTLPNSLLTLTCNENILSNLPTLPSNLTYLNCDNNQLTSLPALPNSLLNIYSALNQITVCPSLPDSLKTLQLQINLLTQIPALPQTLEVLAIDNNDLNFGLPNLPNNLKTLGCGFCNLSSLPALPNSLVNLWCNNNQLTSISSLPNNLNSLLLNNNNLLCLPQLPSTLVDSNYFDISNNQLTCLPNYVGGMDALDLALPLCTSGNTNGCPVAKGIVGKVYKDVNSNCILNTDDSVVYNIPVKFYNPITNVFGTAYTAANGVYNYVCNTGTNLVLVDTLNKPYKANCPHPGIDSTVVTTTANALAQNVNFDIACKNGFDVGVQSISHTGLVFPGQTHTLQVLGGDVSQWYGLNCSAGSSGQVAITINGPVTFAGVPNGALTPSINGNVYTYNIADFGAINSQTAFRLLLTTNTSAQSGNSVCVNINISTTSLDNDTLNNNLYLCYGVVNSYDPNYKEVYPTNVAPGFQDWFTYTVHFQNLGTAAAININVLDTLDANLDEQTFEVINYSHYNETTLQDHIINFRFPNIMLPDSASNPSGSQGFVQYRIKPLANLPVGTQIKNTAHIYFDFNPAIVTNTTENNFVTTVGNITLPQVPSIQVYPNPSSGVFMISAKANIEVYNLVGELVLTENNATSIDLTAAPKGMYFIKLNGGRIEKLIKN
jgi:uncharacterized repeat protein (TIGR01451 family)